MDSSDVYFRCGLCKLRWLAIFLPNPSEFTKPPTLVWWKLSMVELATFSLSCIGKDPNDEYSSP
jgi:hypothetical protein